jgi:hypothetical protein
MSLKFPITDHPTTIRGMIRRLIAIREDIAMAFFKRELSPVERFEVALREKQTTRQKLADRLRAAETLLEEKRAVAEKLAMAGASSGRLDRADAEMRAVEDRVKTQRAALAEVDEQVASTERALADVTTQRDRDTTASGIEAMALAIEQAAPGFGAGAAALVGAVTKSGASVLEATRFAASVDAVRREILSAADLICWELRSAAVQTRAGNANISSAVPVEPEQSPSTQVERQLIYTLNPLQWREGTEVRRVTAFTLVGLPTSLLAIALRHQHVDHLNARRVQTLMHVHGSGQPDHEPASDDPLLVDLDALITAEQKLTPEAQADVA